MSDKAPNASRSAGMHNGDKSRARAIPVAAPNAKIAKRVAARLAIWEATTGKLKTKGRQKPGSQAKARSQG